MKHIHIFDTTLRDGQQSPGAGMSLADNIAYAQLAKKLGVDILEAGFPSASQAEFERVQTIIKEIVDEQSPVICGLTQVRDHLVAKTIESLLPAVKYNKGKMHIYIPIDPPLAEASLGTSEVGKFAPDIYKYCKQASDSGLQVEFSLEGYSRIGINREQGTELINAAIEGGALTINCPDTIGIAHRSQGDEFFVNTMQIHADYFKTQYPDKQLIRSTHNHNDIGTAVENSILAVTKGPATQIECTINGVGERAGNASLEQIAMQIALYGEQMGIFTNIKLEYLQEISDFIAQRMLTRQLHRPVTGINAARHTSGGHVNALLKNPMVYQPFDPKLVGKPGITLMFGPSSGGNHAREIINTQGYECPKELAPGLAQYLKDRYADRYKGIADEEVLAGFLEYIAPLRIDEVGYSKSQGQIHLEITGKIFEKESLQKSGEGKDSALAVFKSHIDEHLPGRSVAHYSSKADTSSINAESITTIILNNGNDERFTGVGVDQDIEIAAIKALADGYNQVAAEQYKK